MKTEYLDKNKKTTVASDRGYAIKKQTKTETRVLEEYFDADSNPIMNSEGYHSVVREYDEQGNNIFNVYNNIDSLPVINASGYAIERKTYSEDGKELSVRYYDANEKPVFTPLNGCGIVNEYGENGRVCRITYIDDRGMPAKTGRGYAILTRTYYSDDLNNGKTENEFYYDENGLPISLSIGEYGVHKEYQDDCTFLTYLNADGDPMVTLQGYTTIARTLNADNSVNTVKYYGIDGNPIALSEGQYGFRMVNGKRFYLNKNGREVISFRNYLYGQPRWTIVFALCSMILFIVMKRKGAFLCLIVYVFVILYMTVMFRSPTKPKADIELFGSYKHIFTSAGTRADIIKNIWLFIPLGVILFRLFPRKTVLLVPIAISILIETVQYFSGMGLCELDDVISNGLGGLIGYEIGKWLTTTRAFFKYGERR